MIQLSAEGAKKLHSMMAAFERTLEGVWAARLPIRASACLSLRFLRCLLLDLYCDTNARRSRRRRSIQEMETRVHWPADGGGKMCSASHAWKLSSDSTMCLCPSAVT